MKIFTFLNFFFFLSSSSVFSQNISNYVFTTQNGTYTALNLASSTPSSLSTGTLNEGLFNDIPIGFDFFYLGVRHNTLSASTNGWLALTPGSITSSSAANNFNSNSAPINFIAPLWDDLDLSSGGFRYQTSGTAPNRVFTAEWSNVEWNWNTNTSVISFQAKLFESTGQIQFEYRQEAGAVAGASASIGIRGNNGVFIFQSLNGTGSSPSISTTFSTNNLNTKPATGQIYRFTPNAINAPINFSANLITTNSMRINWTDNVSNETNYVIYRSTDNVNFGFIEIIPANSNSYDFTNLPSGTQFFYRVFALNEGRLSNALTGTASTLLGTIGGTINIPGNYNTLTAAFNALRTSGMASSVILQLNTGYNSSLETYPINVSSIGTSANRTLTLRPASNVTSLTISSQANTSAFNIANTNFFIIDGRPGGTGTNRALNITCPNGTNTIFFEGDCNNDTIRFCRMSLNDNGSGAFPSSSVITFASFFSQPIVGSNNNAIINNEIFGINPPSSLINFTSGIFTSNQVVSQRNVISNNLLYDFSGVPSFFSGNSAINIFGFVDQFTINGNSIYQTSTISNQTSGSTNTLSGIKLYSYNSGNHSISNNFIGGSAPLCAGNPWEVGPVSEPNSVIPIDVYVTGTSSFNITGNTIRNFFVAGSINFFGIPSFSGIKFFNNGRSTNVSISNNVVGDNTTTNSINILNEGNSTNLVAGIIVESGDSSNILVNNNSIGSYNLQGTTSNDGIYFYGIAFSSSGSISNNIIGSLTNENSIRTISSASNSNQAIVGITNSVFPGSFSRPENIVINNNTISGLRNNFAGSSTIDRMVGIDLIGCQSLNIQGNLIQNLVSSNSASNANTFTLKGIQVLNNSLANSSAYNIQTNTIRNLNNVSANGIINMAGIYLNSISANKNEISRNFIHSFNQVSQSNNSNMVGIMLLESSTRVVNNMIRLGINAAGTSMAAPININCLENNSLNDVEVWNNSFFVGGSLTSSTSNTYCVKRNGNGNFDLVNNVLVNNRSFTTASAPRNFAVFSNSSGQFTGRTNCYFYTGIGTALAQLGTTNFDSIIPWRAASGMDANSGRRNPNFVNATGSISTVDLHVTGTTAIESNGSLLPLVLVDFDGQNRSSLTPNDIGADAGIFTTATLPVKWKTFEVQPINRIANVKFATSQEINNKEFEIERSLDAVSFKSIKTIEGKGNSNIVSNYFYADDLNELDKKITVVYYRIKQIDFDGKFSYTQVKKVNLEEQTKSNSFVIYPNPANEKVFINGLNENATNKIYIYDINGQLVKQVNLSNTNDGIDVTDLPAGIYIVGVNDGAFKQRLVRN